MLKNNAALPEKFPVGGSSFRLFGGGRGVGTFTSVPAPPLLFLEMQMSIQ